MKLDRYGAELLFQVLTEREEKNSVAIAPNESLGGWTRTFTDPRLCAAIVDRLTFGGNIIESGTDSYRLATTAPARISKLLPADHKVVPFAGATSSFCRGSQRRAAPTDQAGCQKPLLM
ncbi:hypothetical protein GCM10022284_75980 [Streptomyces hundungensis]